MKKEYTFFSSAHGPFSRIDHILGHKSSLSKFKKIAVVNEASSPTTTLRLDINHKKEKCKKHRTWRLNNTFLNNQQVTEK